MFGKKKKPKTRLRQPPKPKRPEVERWWTTLYYGARGSGKTLHQAKVVWGILKYLDWLYYKKPELNRAIVFSVQKFSPAIEKIYLYRTLFYWIDAEDLRYCPRKKCWKGLDKHRLHGAYIIFDDMATILPADNWSQTPVWLRKTFTQARHFGIRILANCQDPFSVDINFRRYVDMAFRFRKVIGSRDPDETKPPIKRIWGWYHRRSIKAELLWKLGDMSEDEIQAFKEKQRQLARVSGRSLFREVWRGGFHWISKKVCAIYDTTQDVPEYKPLGFAHTELRCVDPAHEHIDKTAPNYCSYKKVIHELI